MEHMTKKELATLAGYSYRQLYNIDKALPKDAKLFVECEDGKYDPTLFVKRWVDYNVNGGVENDDSLEDVKARHEAVKMQKTELEVQRMRGLLVDINEVYRLWATVAHTASQNLLQLSAKIAPQVTGMTNTSAIAGIIERDVRAILASIADTPIPETVRQTETEEEVEEA